MGKSKNSPNEGKCSYLSSSFDAPSSQSTYSPKRILLYKTIYFLLSFIICVVTVQLKQSSSILHYVIFYWAFIFLPLTEYWITLSSLSVANSIFTGCHFIYFIGVLDHLAIWKPYQIELYATLFCYYRISLSGIVIVNIIVFVLLEFGPVRVVQHPLFSWPLFLHATWANRIFFRSRAR